MKKIISILSGLCLSNFLFLQVVTAQNFTKVIDVSDRSSLTSPVMDNTSLYVVKDKHTLLAHTSHTNELESLATFEDEAVKLYNATSYVLVHTASATQRKLVRVTKGSHATKEVYSIADSNTVLHYSSINDTSYVYLYSAKETNTSVTLLRISASDNLAEQVAEVVIQNADLSQAQFFTFQNKISLILPSKSGVSSKVFSYDLKTKFIDLYSLGTANKFAVYNDSLVFAKEIEGGKDTLKVYISDGSEQNTKLLTMFKTTWSDSDLSLHIFGNKLYLEGFTQGLNALYTYNPVFKSFSLENVYYVPGGWELDNSQVIGSFRAMVARQTETHGGLKGYVAYYRTYPLFDIQYSPIAFTAAATEDYKLFLNNDLNVLRLYNIETRNWENYECDCEKNKQYFIGNYDLVYFYNHNELWVLNTQKITGLKDVAAVDNLKFEIVENSIIFQDKASGYIHDISGRKHVSYTNTDRVELSKLAQGVYILVDAENGKSSKFYKE